MHTIPAGRIDIVFYTDPLCCWSWAWEPQRVQLQAMLGEQANWQLTMGGLIPDWEHFRDETSSVTRPSQMGPVWMHAGQITNRPIAHQLWHTAPPATSYPSCIAVKCAQLQSKEMGFAMFQALQNLAMEQGWNIAKKEVILEAGHKVADQNPLFNTNIFENDFLTGRGQPSFREDLDSVNKHNIRRFPSLTIRASGKTLLISGGRDATTIFNAIQNIAPWLIDQ